jgi:signal transduction histidine kinase
MTELDAPPRNPVGGFARLGRRGALFDVTVASGVAGIGVTVLYLLFGPLASSYRKVGSPPYYLALSIIGVLAMTLPLALRRVYPVTTLVVVTAASVLLALERVPAYFAANITIVIAIYTVGVYAPGRRALFARVFTVLVVIAVTAYLFSRGSYPALAVLLAALDNREQVLFVWFSGGSVGVTMAAITAAWIFGDVMHRLRLGQAELAARTADLARANQTIADQAVADERLRIARELHDVVAHHVSVMGLQAGAARRVLERDPSIAVQALHVVEDTGRQAVAELQRMLGMLRGGAARDDGQPQPTMSDLMNLVERMRETGLDVRMRMIGARPALPAGVELSIYRIAQEGLTNALKHAGTRARVDVDLEFTRTQLQLAIRSRGAPGAAKPPLDEPSGAVGRGLIGMRERTGMHGGQLRTQTLDDGRFEVLATIPL